MALPPGFLDALRVRVPLSDVVGRRVRWDSRRSNPGKGDFWACCPFHQEKSPSFHVDDRKGFYHCFGCQAKGDAITFLREAENMGFMEAVEELARLAGMDVPREARADPEAEARRRAQAGLADWLEEAARFFHARLRAGGGQIARDYLARRGLSPETQARFGLGFAPDERTALRDHLVAKGASVEALLEAGLVRAPEEGGAPYDFFRGRVTFPIRDGRGRCIGFGARALAANARAKYLNSPQTPLFDKSRTLYNLGPAREAAGKSGRLVAVEGYMDVIGLAQVGVADAVAPLGTAVTAEHLRAMWRVADEPLIALDGDKAGLAAAMRLVDVALPLLEPGKSLRFALLPPGKDPDDLAREGGAAAVEAALAQAEPMAALLWRRETEGKAFDSPERRRALDRRLAAALAVIADRGLREHYREFFRERRAALFAPAARGENRARRFDGATARRRAVGDFRGAPPPPPSAALRASGLARSASASFGLIAPAEMRAHEAAALAALLRRPDMVERWADELAAAEFVHADLDEVRGALLAATLDGGAPPDAERVLRAAGLAAEVGYARAEAPGEEVAQGLREAFDRLAAQASLRRELSEAEAAFAAAPGEEVDQRLSSAATAHQKAAPGRLAETDEDEARLSQELRAAIDAEIWIRKKRGR